MSNSTKKKTSPTVKHDPTYDITWKSNETKTTLCKLWKSMWRRCNDKNHASYDYYKNVPIQREWRDFANFKAFALKAGYTRGMSPDRIDNNYGYTPENLQFVAKNLNKKRPIMMTYKGESVKLVDLAKMFGVPDSRLRWYFYQGYSAEDAELHIRTCTKKKRKVSPRVYRDDLMSGKEIFQICTQLGLPQYKVARKLGVSPQRFSAWVRDENRIPKEFQTMLENLVNNNG